MKILQTISSFLPLKALLRSSLFGILILSLHLSVILGQSLYFSDDGLMKNPSISVPQRMLTEIHEEKQYYQEQDISSLNKPSLSIGKVMGSLKIDAVSMVLSEDHKIAFILTRYADQLKVVDISDFEFPRIVSSVSFDQTFRFFNSRGMAVAPDGKILYMSNSHFLEVFEISEPEYTVSIAQVEDKVLFEKTADCQIPEVYNPKILFSKDKKFLFVGGLGLQIFDVSDPLKPILVSSQMSSIVSKKVVPASIALYGETLFYSDGELKIFDVQNPRSINQIGSSFKIDNDFVISSMKLSKDGKTAYVVSLDEEAQVILTKIDVSDRQNIKELQTFPLEQSSAWPPVFLQDTPNDIFLLIFISPRSSDRSSQQLLIFDTTEERLTMNSQNLVKGAYSAIFSQDYKNIFVITPNKFNIIELYLNYPNKFIYSTSSSLVKSFEMESACNSFSLRADQEIVYMNSEGETRQDVSEFGIYQMKKNSSELVKLHSYPSKEEIKKMFISEDNKRAYLLFRRRLQVLDIENKVLKIGEFSQEDNTEIWFENFVLGGKTAFIAHPRYGENYLISVDFSDVANPKKIGSIALDSSFLGPKMILSRDKKTLFLIENIINIIDVSDARGPVIKANISLSADIGNPHFVDVVLSHDEKTLFVKLGYKNNYISLHIFDVSTPRILSAIRLGASEYGEEYMIPSIARSPDSKIIYITRYSYILAIDVANPSSPVILGTIKTFDEGRREVRSFVVSEDGKTGYLATVNGELAVVSILPTYTAYIPEQNILLGEKYSLDLLMLKQDARGDYARMEEKYKFIGFSQVELNLIETEKSPEILFKMAPSWMSFALNFNTLTIEPRRRSDIGGYRVHFAFSTKIPEDIFETIGVISQEDGFEDLMSSLLALGYIDNQMFLTENFGEFEDFVLVNKYVGIRKEVYRVLKQHYFETYNYINVVSSLRLFESNSNKLQIETSSTSSLRVEISLKIKSLGAAQFLSRSYGSLVPSIKDKKTRIILEGSLKNVNQALKELVVDLENVNFCDGEINVSDKLNPPITQSMKNISRFFDLNKPPGVNPEFMMTVQEQVDRSLVYTGQYFQIRLNESRFLDQYTLPEDLNYQVVLVKKEEESALPSWLTFGDMTLMGTAPESIFERDFELRLIVKNEFQEFKEGFKLHVSISYGYVLKLLINYSPYILSILGLIISANKIFNIVFKGMYKHPKDFYLRVGEEVSSEVIFPVGFIREEIQEAKRILRVIEKKFGKGRQLLSYFMVGNGEKKLDKLKVLETIKESLNELSFRERKNFRLYLEGAHPERIINQIIINTLVKEMLNGDKETKKIFEKIKKQWSEYVEWDLRNSSFRINNERLRKHGDGFNDETMFVSNDGESLLEASTSLSRSSLLGKSKINIDLLKDSILAYAFECQNINILPVFVQFNVKERIKGNFLKQFLKLDLRDCPFREKGKIGYGVEYFREYQTLYFQGVVRPDMRNKTLIVQITNLQHKILRELWLIGDSEDEGVTVVNDKREIEAKGKGYEVF